MIYEDDLYEGDPEKWSQPLWKTEILIGKGLPGGKAQDVADALEDLAVSVFLHNLEATDGDCWAIGITTLGRPELTRISSRLKNMGFSTTDMRIETNPVEQKDWLKHVHENFPPVTVGGFFVFGSHYAGEKPANLIPLQIDAATAFGSGEHETTKGCLLALEKLAEKHAFKTGLDMGCGSGILAIAMAKLWPEMKIAAVDIDPESVAVTKRHIALNHAEASIETAAGDGYKCPLAKGFFDVVAANILAGPLVVMAPELVKVLKPGGFAVLSGLLRRQMADVVQAHENHGLKLVFAEDIGDWQALVLQKPL